MEIFRKKIGPVFVKESSDTAEYISKLDALKEKASDSLKPKIEQEIKYAKYGEIGEKNVAFELKNSGMDMMILHDLHLETDDLSAQIDYLVITRKTIFVIECKNLYGNIKIDNKGNFIRLRDKGNEVGMYSPVTQNERHLQVLKKVRANAKNFLQKSFFEKNFENTYKSIIVLANPQNVIYDQYAPEAITEKVIRYDRLISYIKKVNDESNVYLMSADKMKKLAEFFLNQSVPTQSDYARKYEEMIENIASDTQKEEPQPEVSQDADNANLIQQLKAYRLQQSKQNHLKPYYIFNDAQMNDLIEKMPKTIEDLLTVSGFGPAKVDKYGDDILKILNNKH